jgi:4-amino-4-deoxy-L-arabinose transferase-like glycosyltransferase
MRKTGFTVLVLAFFLFVFLSQLSLIHHPVSDNDEGVYATSFLLMDNGFPAYKQTFFSQPPGFIISVFPGFMFLGKTLEAARLTIGLWTLLGLAGLIWVGFELKNKWIGLFTALLLYLIPTYYNQTLILQSDILVRRQTSPKNHKS